MVLVGKSVQKYPVDAGIPDNVIQNIAIYADDTTRYPKCEQATDLSQQLEFVSELGSDL